MMPSRESGAGARTRASSTESIPLTEGWELASCAPGSHEDPRSLDDLHWRAARVPGTAAAALRDAGAWRESERRDFDAEDWWFRTRFDAAAAAEGEQLVLVLGGIATVAEVHLNGELLLRSESMFERNELDVGGLAGGRNELAIRCCALAPLLAQRRKPRARWRTRLVADGNLRFFRTMLLGRAPGFAPGPAAVGPWRGVSLERRSGILVEDLRMRTAVEGQTGRVRVSARVRTPDGEPPERAELELRRPSGSERAPLVSTRSPGGASAEGELTFSDVELWWPHTHGEPVLHEACLHIEHGRRSETIELGRVGFRTLRAGAGDAHDTATDGVDLHVNGVRVFARGAVWTPADFVSMAPSRAELREALEQVHAAGMNIVRVPGTSAYESEDFHELCDELGVLVWQDFMFANLDYPISDERFRAHVEREAAQVLGDVGAHPSTAVLCGNSEVEQQVAMLGLDPQLGRGELFGELLPARLREHAVDAVYVPSAPCGGDQPFRPDRGVANYYGVGGYRRPLEDARRAEVRFAAECLAFANVPCEETIEGMLPQAPSNVVVHHPVWKAGVPRDAGAGWDFDDVRDHYLALLYDLDPGELRRVDHARYLELSRHASGEAMAEVLGEWRREQSPCAGAIVLWLRDLVPGAGWGLVDAHGEPKAAYHYVRRACAPVSVWTSDEGLGGIVAHIANDRATPLRARLRLSLYREQEHLVEEATREIELAPHSAAEWNVEALLGRFLDVGFAFRFGPPQHDLLVASLEASDGTPISQAMRFPTGRPRAVEPSARAGARASVARIDDGHWRASVSALRMLYGVRVHVSAFRAAEDAFCVEPGRERSIELTARHADAGEPVGFLTAANLEGRIALVVDGASAVRASAPASEGALA